MYCYLLGKEKKTEICQLLTSCRFPLRKIGHRFSPTTKRSWWEQPSCLQKQQEKQPFFANLPNTACLQTLWQQLILVHLRLNFFAFHFFCQSDIIRNHALIFMRTCLIFPPLVSFPQYYASHWMALSPTSSPRQKPGNYIQVLLFSILYPACHLVLSIAFLKFTLLSSTSAGHCLGKKALSPLHPDHYGSNISASWLVSCHHLLHKWIFHNFYSICKTEAHGWVSCIMNTSTDRIKFPQKFLWIQIFWTLTLTLGMHQNSRSSWYQEKQLAFPRSEENEE